MTGTAGVWFAVEADPGRLTASHPLHPTRAEADAQASAPCMWRAGLPMPRVLRRVDGGPWVAVGRGSNPFVSVG